MLEIHRTSYITFNTPQFLIKRYAETTSRIEKNHFDANAENLKSESPTGYYENIDVNISLITLNCSILEGIIRHSFSSILISDQMKMGDIIESTTDVNNLNVLIRARRLIEDIQINIETQSAWSLLIKSIQSYSDINIKNIADVRYDVISAIFSMRNCFAHGTAITLSPSVEVENEYLLKWKSKLASINSILQAEFGFDLIDALRLPGFALFFFNETQKLLKSLMDVGFTWNQHKEFITKVINYDFGMRF